MLARDFPGRLISRCSMQPFGCARPSAHTASLRSTKHPISVWLCVPWYDCCSMIKLSNQGTLQRHQVCKTYDARLCAAPLFTYTLSFPEACFQSEVAVVESMALNCARFHVNTGLILQVVYKSNHGCSDQIFRQMPRIGLDKQVTESGSVQNL